MFKIILMIPITFVMLHASGRIANFSATNKVNEIVVKDNNVYVLTSGGLFIHDVKSDNKILHYGSLSFPDPNLTAFCFDDKNKLWIGSHFGYMATWESDRWGELSKSYQTAGWQINTLLSYPPYLIVGTSKGVSLFDVEKMRAEKSAVQFNNLKTTNVSALIVHKDKLYVRLENEVVRLDNISSKLDKYNFFDPSIWNIDSSFIDTIQSFVIDKDSLYAFPFTTVSYKNSFLSAQGTSLMYGGKQVAQLPSDITCLTVSGDVCWIGTSSDYYYKWNGSTLSHYSIPGPTFTGTNALTVDKGGDLWVVPTGALNVGALWWKGFYQFNGTTWSIYNTANSPLMGGMPPLPDSKGLAVSRDGAVWFSTSGAHLKRYTPSDKSWSQFCTFSQGGSDGKFYQGANCEVGWAKTDAVAQDSSGFIWIGCWENPDGLLICYDPKYEPSPENQGTPNAHYRRFFPEGDLNYSKNVSTIVADSYGHILVGNINEMKLTVLHHNGDPITSGVEVVKVFEGIGTVVDAVSSSNGNSYLVTSKKGLCEFNPQTRTLKQIENIKTGITAIEIEDDNILWLALESEGIIRYNINTEQQVVVNRVNGLVSLSVRDLAIDRQQGFLWAATDIGVSRITLGLQATPIISSKMTVYPIPFIKRRHTALYFNNIPVKSKVSIFSIQGQLIANASLEMENAFNSAFTWTVPPSTTPGTYYYSIYGNDNFKSESGKILIVP